VGSGGGQFAPLTHTYDPESKSNAPIQYHWSALKTKDAGGIQQLFYDQADGRIVPGMLLTNACISVLAVVGIFLGSVLAIYFVLALSVTLTILLTMYLA
jgi:hypothetical protein